MLKSFVGAALIEGEDAAAVEVGERQPAFVPARRFAEAQTVAQHSSLIRLHGPSRLVQTTSGPLERS